MANGSTRIAQAEMVIRREEAQAEVKDLKELDKGELPKFPLKAGKKD